MVEHHYDPRNFASAGFPFENGMASVSQEQNSLDDYPRY